MTPLVSLTVLMFPAFKSPVPPDRAPTTCGLLYLPQAPPPGPKKRSALFPDIWGVGRRCPGAGTLVK